MSPSSHGDKDLLNHVFLTDNFFGEFNAKLFIAEAELFSSLGVGEIRHGVGKRRVREDAVTLTNVSRQQTLGLKLSIAKAQLCGEL